MTPIYEYTPNRKKTPEMLTALLLLALGIALLYVSQIPNIPYPVLFQSGTFVLAVAAVLIVGRFVMRGFTYRVEPSENDPDACELVVVEHYGRRNTVVCRVGLWQIASVVRPADRETRALLAGKQKGKTVYRYTAAFSDPDLCVVEAAENDDGTGETVFIRMCADQALFDLLLPRNSNYCPSNNEN